ncbi:hypothetical protein P280DRAFT_482352 [Massarina eburnea CBS 473.64]|uniref:Uncharacterized protein n=1 Tax=Massarina eburnea CBS 473.64 TaxID=1395130 RepID=A0A6A6RRS4_9PLEO|nr:hypothetical protein P280DRAFT_482352 [Massarina eburnea CBS 473.64]
MHFLSFFATIFTFLATLSCVGAALPDYCGFLSIANGKSLDMRNNGHNGCNATFPAGTTAILMRKYSVAQECVCNFYSQYANEQGKGCWNQTDAFRVEGLAQRTELRDIAFYNCWTK